MGHRRRLGASCAGSFLVVGLVACQSTPPVPPDSEDAANIYVSAYPAVPWSEISAKLEPKHALTTEQARNLAAQTTQVQVSQFLSTFAAALGIGLPVRTDLTTITRKADGTEETTGTRTRGSGTAPSSSGLASTAIPDTALAADLSRGPFAPGLDASTLLNVGTAVYQQAQILDNQITKGVLPKGYQAHLVTLQVNLQPKSRSFAYDAYLNVTFMPRNLAESETTSGDLATDSGALPAVIVYPLVISDAMETTSVGKSVEAVRQAALQLSGVVGGVGVNAGVSGGSDKVEAALGLDKNSLVTVGRVSDHTLRIRLGAQNAGSQRYAMVPRTHNISVVVLTRWGKKPDRVTSLSVVTHTTLISSDNAVRLTSGRDRDRRELATRVANSIAQYHFGPIDATCKLSRAVPATSSALARAPETTASTEEDIDRHLNLLRALDRGDYATVAQCLQAAKQPAADEVAYRRLLAALMEIQTDSRYSKVQIALREIVDPKLPAKEQLVIYSDDGKSAMSFVIRGGEGLTENNVRAELDVKPLAGKTMPTTKLLPTALAVGGRGDEVTVTFPSLASLKLEEKDLADPPLRLLLANDATTNEMYRVRIAAEPEKKGPGNPVTASQNVLVADTNGLARVTLQIGKAAKEAKLPLTLVVEGADVRNDGTPGSPKLLFNGVAVAPESTTTLMLGNLVSTRTVSVKTVDGDSKPQGSALTITVERLAARAD
ncbi:MAG: hypothetical protein IT353_07555 [Gemmatimonadaceae bacterium]|nr:hypothetical protein [Gemmatimonadaceae bacterium]